MYQLIIDLPSARELRLAQFYQKVKVKILEASQQGETCASFFEEFPAELVMVLNQLGYTVKEIPQEERHLYYGFAVYVSWRDS